MGSIERSFGMGIPILLGLLSKRALMKKPDLPSPGYVARAIPKFPIPTMHTFHTFLIPRISLTLSSNCWVL